MAVTDPFYDRVGSNVRGPYPSTRPEVGGIGSPVHTSTPSGVCSCWAQSDNAYYGITKSHETLPPGIYDCAWRDFAGPTLERRTIRTDDLIQLPDSVASDTVEEIRRFRTRRDRFNSLGFLHKRGVLLWGPAGSGKTSLIMQLCDLIVAGESGVAVYAGIPELTAKCLQLLRRIEPDRPLIVIFEDLDALVERHGENEYLSLLDGESQVDNVVTVASTNYPERLDRRFVDRPGRFASIRFIGMPSRLARAAYIAAKCPQLVDGNLEAYLDATEELSIDHVREILVLTQCDDLSLDEAASRMRAMRQARPISDRSPESRSAGFGYLNRRQDLGSFGGFSG